MAFVCRVAGNQAGRKALRKTKADKSQGMRGNSPSAVSLGPENGGLALSVVTAQARGRAETAVPTGLSSLPSTRLHTWGQPPYSQTQLNENSEDSNRADMEVNGLCT